MSAKKAVYAIVILFVICVLLSLWVFFSEKEVAVANIYSNGQLVETLPLSRPTTRIIESFNGGSNTIEVRDGKISVTNASCPDHICISFGWCNSGLPIVCLPNGLVIEFPGGENYDIVSG